MTRQVSAGLAWLALAQFFLAQIAAQLMSTVPYRPAHQFVSDLGNTACGPYRYYTDESLVEVCSPGHWLVNASFVLSGLLLAGGVVLTWRHWPFTAAKVLFVVAGVGWVLAGLAPENENIFVHGIGALLLIVGGNLGLLLLGWRGARRWALAAGVIGLAATVLFLGNQFLGLGLGTMERLAVYPLILWAIGTGIGWVSGRRQFLDPTRWRSPI